MRKLAIVLAVLAVCGFATTQTAEAGPYGGYGYGYGSGYGGYGYGSGYGYGFCAPKVPVYHAPSVHFDRVYHPTYSHWTPGRGFHTHGHYDTVPHYTPGHFDIGHGNHVHGNPWYHH